MIAMLPDAIGNHVFKVSVTDLAGQTTVQDLTFHYGQVTLETADLWQNTATLKIVPSATAASATLEYKRSTDDAWQQATVSDNGNGTFTAAIEPTWSSSTNEMGKTVYEPDYATGVFAGTTYDYRLKLDGTEKETGRFTTAKGDVIPNADMSEWSTVSRAGLSGSKDVPYPNKTGDSFWDCGNNGITTDLCSSTTDKFGAAAPAAKLQSKNMFVLAAGNLFTGSFNYASMTGTVKFGSKYTYTARPKALRVKYHATTGDIDIVRSQNPHLQLLMPVPWHRVDLQLIMVARDRKRRRAVGVQLTPVFVQLCAAGAKCHPNYLHFDGIIPESRRIPRIIPPLLMV